MGEVHECSFALVAPEMSFGLQHLKRSPENSPPNAELFGESPLGGKSPVLKVRTLIQQEAHLPQGKIRAAGDGLVFLHQPSRQTNSRIGIGNIPAISGPCARIQRISEPNHLAIGSSQYFTPDLVRSEPPLVRYG